MNIELDERERSVIDQCILYSKRPCGLPGHMLMLLVAKLYLALVEAQANHA